MGIAESRRWLLLVLLIVLAGACSSVPRPEVTPGPPEHGSAATSVDCQDLTFRGRYLPADGEKKRRSFRANARVCAEGPVLFEIRGRVGGAVLSGAVETGDLLLLFPRDRLAVSGPDDPRVWHSWTGLPLSEAMLRRIFADPREATRVVEGWIVERLGTGEPLKLQARNESGDLLEIVRTGSQPAHSSALRPEIPPKFQQLEVTAEQPRRGWESR